MALIIIITEAFSFYRLSPQRLYAEKFIPYQLTSTDDPGMSKIEKAYNEKKYWDVITFSAGSVVSATDIFLTGLAWLEVKNYSKAVSSFQIVIGEAANNTNIRLKESAEYYLALAYLQNQDYDQAIELMSSIHNNSSHGYRAKFSRRYINRVKRLKWR